MVNIARCFTSCLSVSFSAGICTSVCIMAYTPSYALPFPEQWQLCRGRISPGPHSLSEAMKMTAPWNITGTALQLTVADVILDQRTRPSPGDSEQRHRQKPSYIVSPQWVPVELQLGPQSWCKLGFPDIHDHECYMPCALMWLTNLVILHKVTNITPPLTLILAESSQKDNKSEL